MNPAHEIAKMPGSAPVTGRAACIEGGVMTAATGSGPVRVAHVAGIRKGDNITIHNGLAVKTPPIKSTGVFDV
ncbi:MAG: hypothetical protein GY862_20360 [Gammaproteobacteria bacterium]|nr:hypothetical protein [Gammaproteobacteria bacterium]